MSWGVMTHDNEKDQVHACFSEHSGAGGHGTRGWGQRGRRGRAGTVAGGAAGPAGSTPATERPRRNATSGAARARGKADAPPLAQLASLGHPNLRAGLGAGEHRSPKSGCKGTLTPYAEAEPPGERQAHSNWRGIWGVGRLRTGIVKGVGGQAPWPVR